MVIEEDLEPETASLIEKTTVNRTGFFNHKFILRGQSVRHEKLILKSFISLRWSNVAFVGVNCRVKNTQFSMQGIRNYVEHSTILVYLVGKHDCTLVSMKWSPSFSLKLSNCMMETCMLVAGGEGP